MRKKRVKYINYV